MGVEDDRGNIQGGRLPPSSTRNRDLENALCDVGVEMIIRLCVGSSRSGVISGCI